MEKAKEKAKELVQRFKPHADWNNEYGSAEKQANEKHAKQCALICVDEILSLNCESFDLEPNPHHYYSRNFWKSVKTQIEKL